MKQNISSLNLPKSTITHLKNLGYHYVADINSNPVLKDKFTLQNLTLQKGPPTNSAFEVFQEEVLNGYILSYNEKLDHILKDVIAPKTITEIAGESGSGKTQVCFQLCISVQLPRSCGGFGGEAIYICTNSNFASHRLKELAEAFIEQYNSLKTHDKIDADFILKHIHYIKAKDGLELIACIEYLKSYLEEKNIKLIIIDSISYPIRLLDVNTRKTVICKLFRDLRRLANTYNFAVVLTNNLTTRINERDAYTTPSLGDSFYHLINSRIMFFKKNTVFHGKLLKSTLHGEKETVFFI